jgi:RNA polymerase sigma factor (sigma-70 family)
MASDHDRRESFRALFDRSYGPLMTYAVRRAASRADAEEVVAEALLVAWRRRADMPSDSHALPWLYGVARRVLANQRRGQGRRQRFERLLSPLRSAAKDPSDLAEADDEARAVLAAVARLAEADREVLCLKVWEGLSHAEIAASLGCTENAAAIRLHRARQRLRDELLKEGRLPGQEAFEVIG